MDLDRVLRELHKELDNLDAAIVSLERLHEAAKKLQAARKTLKASAKRWEESGSGRAGQTQGADRLTDNSRR